MLYFFIEVLKYRLCPSPSKAEPGRGSSSGFPSPWSSGSIGAPLNNLNIVNYEDLRPWNNNFMLRNIFVSQILVQGRCVPHIKMVSKVCMQNIFFSSFFRGSVCKSVLILYRVIFNY